MKTSKNRRFLVPRKSKRFSRESKTMDELHKIREEMSKMSEEEKAELLNSVREKYKDLVYEKEQPA